MLKIFKGADFQNHMFINIWEKIVVKFSWIILLDKAVVPPPPKKGGGQNFVLHNSDGNYPRNIK